MRLRTGQFINRSETESTCHATILTLVVLSIRYSVPDFNQCLTGSLSTAESKQTFPDKNINCHYITASFTLVIKSQRTYTPLVHAYTGRTRVASTIVKSFVPIYPANLLQPLNTALYVQGRPTRCYNTKYFPRERTDVL